MNTKPILHVTPEGEFVWHADADEMIERGDFTGAESMPHLLRRLRQYDDLLASLEQIERLSRDADGSLVDVRAILGDIARAAIAEATGGAA